jgi:hypothetical protein
MEVWMSGLGDLMEGTTDTEQNDVETQNEITNNAEGDNAPDIGDPDWYWAEGVKGEGKPPDGYNTEKYQFVAEQAQAQQDLESKFGAFTGTPKDGYEINISEELAERGFSIQDDDPMMEKAIKFASGSEMNNDKFNEWVNLYGEVEAYKAEMEAKSTEDWEKEQLSLIGNDANAQIKEVVDWGRTNLSPAEYKYLEGMETTAGNVKLVQSLIAKAEERGFNQNDSSALAADTEKELEKMYFEKDEWNNRRLHSDTQFAGEYEQMKNELKRMELGQS